MPGVPVKARTARTRGTRSCAACWASIPKSRTTGTEPATCALPISAWDGRASTSCGKAQKCCPRSKNCAIRTAGPSACTGSARRNPSAVTIPVRQSAGPLDPIVAKARTALRRMLEPVLTGEDRKSVVVACSGGPDSLALAATAAFVLPRLGARAGAVVVDHGLQAGSAAAAQTAAEECRALGLNPVTVITTAVDLGPGSGGLEAAARTARYSALREQQSVHAARALVPATT